MLITDPAIQVDQIYRIEETPPNILKRLGLKKASDNGIDTVIIDKNDRIIAVQDKFRTVSADSVTWGDLSTFFGDSVKADFRLVVTTADHVDRLDKAPDHGRLQKICSAHLNTLSRDRIHEIISWIDNQKITLKRKQTKPHQNRAIKDIVREFRTSDRALFISACGTGKTLSSERVMEKVLGANGGDVIVFLPSLNLVRQTIRSWSNELTNHSRYRFMAICSDKTVANTTSNNQDDDADIGFEEIGIPVSTDFTDLNRFLSRKRDKGELRIVYTTYQSSKVVADAIRGTNLKFDFASFDEAHRTVTAGSTEFVRNKSSFSHGLFDENIPIAKRLFMTATAKKRIQRNISSDKDSFTFISMDDTSKYGNVAHRYTFREAADEGVICPFKIIVSVVNPKEISEFRINKVTVDGTELPFEEAARQLSIRKAIEKASANRVITYHSRLTDAEYFSQSVKSVLPDWNTGFISSKQGVALRDKITQIVRDTDNSLVTNVRCLAEGMDFPAVDMVSMMSRIDSKTEVIQIVGRALRKPDTGAKQFGYVMLPLIISSSSEIFEEEITKLGFETIWNVVGALMDDDEELFSTIEDLSVASSSGDKIMRNKIGKRLSSYIEIIGIDSDVLYETIQTQITSHLHSSFSVGLGHLKQYIADHGTSTMSTNYRTKNGFPLAKWLSNRKSEWTSGKLSAERIQKLEELDISAVTRSEQSNLGLRMLREYIEEFGTPNVPAGFIYKDFPLKSWLSNRKRDVKIGRENKRVIRSILKMGYPLLETPKSSFDLGREPLKSFVSREGHANVPVTHIDNSGFKLGQWIRNMRAKWKNKELTRAQISFLTRYGVHKNQYENQFETFASLLRKIAEETGSPNVPDTFEYEGKRVGAWLRDNRKKWRDNKLSPQRIRMLEELGVNRGASLAERRKRKLKATKAKIQKNKKKAA
jgi:superfamily II DNA or RNA helicase